MLGTGEKEKISTRSTSSQSACRRRESGELGIGRGVDIDEEGMDANLCCEAAEEGAEEQVGSGTHRPRTANSQRRRSLRPLRLLDFAKTGEV